ncbi:MAG: TatD family hydrolase [Methanomicrobia archaeon]|nr:TatD family hydrolase [Methanomicrobia archaeon]
MIEIIDIHCHLTFEQYDEDREQVIKDAKAVLKGVVSSGVEPGDSKKALELATMHEGFIFVTLGLHPIHVAGKTDQEIGDYEEFISENKRRIVGIGEIGLDYHWVRDPLKIRRTKEVFVEFLGLAKELDLPVVLHLRGTGSEAIEDGLKIVSDEDIRNAVFHCFTGKPQLAEQICEEGYYISLPASIVRSKSMRKVAKRIPLSLLLTETDAPYLSPTEEERNVPQHVKVVYEEIARQRKIEVREAEEEIERNFVRLFGVELR